MRAGRALACFVAAVVVLVGTVGSRASDPGTGGTGHRPPRDRDRERVEHVLDRIGHGADSWSRSRIQLLGVRGYIDEQLRPESIPDRGLEPRLAGLPSLEMDFEELRAAYPGGEGMPGPGRIVNEMRQAKRIRAIASRRQLEEVLVDFWFNHFNVLAKTKRRSYDIVPYERDAIRPFVLGSFHAMLVHVARSPAMLDYLDNRRNRVGAINENYARELLELHTLGVDGGYTEYDIVEVARCFTGWAEDYDATDGFGFRERHHDQGEKTVLGLSVPAHQGYRDGLIVLDFLAHHSATAHHIARKLVERFVSEEEPPAELVEAAARVFLETSGDLREVTATILHSDEFLDAERFGDTKVKRPMVFVASLARTLGSDPEKLRAGRIDRILGDLGEEPYGCSPPTGYPDRSSHWIGPGSVVLRFNEAEIASRGAAGYKPTRRLPKSDSAETVVDALIRRHFVAGVSESTRAGAISIFESVHARQKGRAAAAEAFLLSSPEFLTH